MGQLTWQNINAPELSIRDLALAGNQVSSAFSRFGQILSDREERLRNEATDSAAAKAYMASTPEEFAQMRAQGLAGLGSRVNALAYAKALGDAENQTIARENDRTQMKLGQETLLDKQAMVELGAVTDAANTALFNGDEKGYQAAMEQAKANPLGARWLAQTSDGFLTVRDTHNDNALQRDEFNETKADNQRQAAARMAGIGIQRQQLQLELADRAERKAHEAEALSGRGFADRYVRALRPGAIGSAADAKVYLARDPHYQAMTERERAAVDGQLDTAWARRFAATRESTAGSQEDFRRNNAAASMASVATDGIKGDFFRAAPGLAIQDSLDRNREAYSKVTRDEIQQLYKERMGSEGVEFVDNALAGGKTLPELRALADVVNLRDDGLISAWANNPVNTYGIVRDYFFGGRNRGREGIKAMDDEGQITAARLGMESQLAPYSRALAQQQAVMARAEQERQATGTISDSTKQQLEIMAKNLEAKAKLYKPARSP